MARTRPLWGSRLSRPLRFLTEDAGRGAPWIGEDITPGRLLEGRYVGLRIAPFVIAGVLPFALLPATGVSYTDPRVLIAAAMIPAILGLALRLPWGRYPAWAQALLPLAYFIVFALLRDADGAPSAFDPLVALPVAWFALYGTGRQLVLSALAAGLTLAAPVLLIGSPAYGSDQFALAAVMIVMAEERWEEPSTFWSSPSAGSPTNRGR